MRRNMTSRYTNIIILASALIVGLCLAIGLAIGLREDCNNENKNDVHFAESLSASGSYHFAGVATDAEICSDIGRDVMARHGGNAIDAAVAATFCVGVVNAHSTGLGGGGFWTIYETKNKSFYSVISRETAPGAATEKMYYAPDDRTKSTFGGMAVGVPGEVMGLWEVHQRFGRVPWKTLVSPVIDLCLNGVPLAPAAHMAAVFRLLPLKDKTGFEMYFDENFKVKPAGSLIRLPKVAKTLQTIADDPMAFYTGSLARDIVQDIQERGGIITLDDLKNYKVQWTKPTEFSMPGNLTMYSTPPPGSGPLLSYIINILKGYHMTADSVATDEAKILTYHRIIEAMKFAFAKRTEMGDARFINNNELLQNLTSPTFGESTRMKITDSTIHDTAYYEPSFYNTEDSGTTHLSVIDGEGNVVAMTGTINTYFGSKVKGSRTGIVFNNEMADFATPSVTNVFNLKPSEANFIRPGKRPMSSMCPAIVWDGRSGKVVLVTGASGGTKISTAVAQVIMNVLWFKMPLTQATDEIRLHHQLLPDMVTVFKDLPSAIKAGLEKKGHKVKKGRSFSVVQSLHIKDDSISATSDYRKGGKPAGF